MTRTANARIAGLTFLLYIAAGITSMVLFRRATGGEGMAAKLAGIAEHATDVGVLVLLGFVQCFSALVLGVTLWAITRDQDNDLAMLGLTCRAGEGIIGGLSIPGILTVFSLATSTGTDAPSVAAAHACRLPAEARRSPPRDLLCRGQHALLVASATGTDDPRPTGLARCGRVGAAGGLSSPEPRWIHPRADYDPDVVADAGVRSAAGAMAADQGRRHADPHVRGMTRFASHQ